LNLKNKLLNVILLLQPLQDALPFLSFPVSGAYRYGSSHHVDDEARARAGCASDRTLLLFYSLSVLPLSYSYPDIQDEQEESSL